MDQAQPATPAVTIGNIPLSQHYLAEIKYPNIPNPIEIDKIFNVLHKIRTTTKPLFYKWQPLNKPKHGEIFLEQKYPVTSDPVSGDQFSIVDDGYLWSSIPKPEVQEYQGQQIEVFKWLEGYSPGDKFFTISKFEYRLKTPNNVLFLIQYLEMKNSNIPVKSALPATKISPIYLQQQFFQQLKQQMAHLTAMRRSPSPVPSTTASGIRPPSLSNAVNRPNTTTTGAKNSLQNRSNSSAAMRTTANTNANVLSEPASSIEGSIDIFDSFGDFEAAFYRLNVIKPLLRRLFELPSSSTPGGLNAELEKDLIAATRKKISTTEERLKNSQKTRQEFFNQLKNDQKRFWSNFSQILNGIDNETDLLTSFQLLLPENHDMDIDLGDECGKSDDKTAIYTSL